MAKPNKSEIRNRAINHVTDMMIEHGKSICPGPGRDFILTDNTTGRIAGLSEEPAVILGSLDDLKADYLIIATNQFYTYRKKIYIMTMDEVREKAVTDLDGKDNWYIEPSVYREYINNYGVLA